MRCKRNAIISQKGSETQKWCPLNVALGLTGPNYIITFNGATLDRCVSSAVEDACNQEFIRRLAQRPTQGLLIRLQNELYLKPEMIGRQSYLRRFLEGKTKTHTRAMYTDTEYSTAIVYTCAVSEKWEDNEDTFNNALKDAGKTYKFLRCPFCIPKITQNEQHMFQDHATELSGLYGNSRHFCFYCLNDSTMTVRRQMTQLLEDHLTDLFRLASNWGRLGFTALLERITIALTDLDRSVFHNAHLKDTRYSKTNPSSCSASLSVTGYLFLNPNVRRWKPSGKRFLSVATCTTIRLYHG